MGVYLLVNVDPREVIQKYSLKVKFIALIFWCDFNLPYILIPLGIGELVFLVDFILWAVSNCSGKFLFNFFCFCSVVSITIRRCFSVSHLRSHVVGSAGVDFISYILFRKRKIMITAGLGLQWSFCFLTFPVSKCFKNTRGRAWDF